MRKVTLTPGKFSSLMTKPINVAPIPVTPDKQTLLDKQRKSIERLSSMNPKTARRQTIEWEMKEQEYKDEINRLKGEKQRLMNRIQEIEKEESNNKILEYEMYIVELNKQISDQKSVFAEKYKELEDQLSHIVSEEENYSNAVVNSERYRNSLYDLIISITTAYGCLRKINTKDLPNISTLIGKQFAKIYSILDPYVRQFEIEGEMEQAMNEQQETLRYQHEEEEIDLQLEIEQQQRSSSSVMTFPPNSVFKETFNKQMFEAEVSTNKSEERSFESHFGEGNSYEVRKEYRKGLDGHLELKPGDEVILLKKNANGMWIGESGENIGYFPEYVLL